MFIDVDRIQHDPQRGEVAQGALRIPAHAQAGRRCLRKFQNRMEGFFVDKREIMRRVVIDSTQYNGITHI